MARPTRTYAVVAGIIVAAIAVAAVAFTANLPRNPAEPKSVLRIAVVTDALFSDEGWGGPP